LADKNKVTSNDQLDPEELAFRQGYAVFLKAAGMSHMRIGKIVLVSRGLVGEWFRDEKMRARVAQTRKDMVSSAITFIHDSTLEAAQILREIARSSSTEATVRVRAAESLLDRAAIAKVNKSETLSRRQDMRPVSITDDDFFERIEGLPLETQRRLAELATAFREELEQAGAPDKIAGEVRAG
jgi:hypothetical protein